MSLLSLKAVSAPQSHRRLERSVSVEEWETKLSESRESLRTQTGSRDPWSFSDKARSAKTRVGRAGGFFVFVWKPMPADDVLCKVGQARFKWRDILHASLVTAHCISPETLRSACKCVRAFLRSLKLCHGLICVIITTCKGNVDTNALSVYRCRNERWKKIKSAIGRENPKNSDVFS